MKWTLATSFSDRGGRSADNEILLFQLADRGPELPNRCGAHPIVWGEVGLWPFHAKEPGPMPPCGPPRELDPRP